MNSVLSWFTCAIRVIVDASSNPPVSRVKTVVTKSVSNLQVNIN